MVTDERPAKATVWLTYPTDVTCNSAFALLTVKVNAPFTSVVEPVVVPLTATDTPGIPSPLASFTEPVTFRS